MKNSTRPSASELASRISVGDRVIVHWHNIGVVPLMGVVQMKSRVGMELKLAPGTLGTQPRLNGQTENIAVRGEVVAVPWVFVKRASVRRPRRAGAA